MPLHSDTKLGSELAFTRFFYFNAFVHESIIRVLPPPPYLAPTIAKPLSSFSQYTAPPPPPTPLLYVLHHTVMVLAISRKGQCQNRTVLRAKHAESINKCGILFIVSLFCDYMNLEYVYVHAICRVNQAKYAIRMLVVAPQEYVDTHSTRRLTASRVPVGLHKILPLPILYGAWHTRGGSGVEHILRDIVCGQNAGGAK